MKLQILIQGDSDSDVERDFDDDDHDLEPEQDLRKRATGASPLGAMRAEPRQFLIKQSSSKKLQTFLKSRASPSPKKTIQKNEVNFEQTQTGQHLDFSSAWNVFKAKNADAVTKLTKQPSKLSVVPGSPSNSKMVVRLTSDKSRNSLVKAGKSTPILSKANFTKASLRQDEPEPEPMA